MRDTRWRVRWGSTGLDDGLLTPQPLHVVGARVPAHDALVLLACASAVSASRTARHALELVDPRAEFTREEQAELEVGGARFFPGLGRRHFPVSRDTI